MKLEGHFSAWGCYFLGIAFLCAGVEPLHAATRIDLEVESAQVRPYRGDEKVEITVSVRNNGSEPAEGVFLQVDVKQDGKRVKAIKDIPVLSNLPRAGVGQSIPISLGQLNPGIYEGELFVDPDNHILETNETNNKRQVRFNVY